MTCLFLSLNPLSDGQSVLCLLQTLVIHFWGPHRRFWGAWLCLWGLSEAGGSGETSQLGGSSPALLKVSLASLQIRSAVVRIIGGSPRTRYPVSPTGGSKVNDYDLRLPQILTSQRVSPYLQKLLMAPAAAPDPACAVSHRVGTRGGGPRQAPGSSRGSSRHSPAHKMLIPVSNRHLPTLSPKGNLEELPRRLELEAAMTPAPPLLLKKLPSWPCPRLQGRVGTALPRGGPAPGFGNPGKSSERRAG